jgi:hypothetical protein
MSKKSSRAVRVEFEPNRFAAEELSKIYESLTPFNAREFRPDVDAVRPIKKPSQSKRRNNGK